MLVQIDSDELVRIRSNAIRNSVTGWRPISEYSRDKYDWVLVKAYDENFECIPFVAELHTDGKWYTHGIVHDEEIPCDVRYFFDMQQLDKKGE